MDLNSVNGSLNASVGITSEVPVAKAAENRQIVQAVAAVNTLGIFGQDNQVIFQRDQYSHRIVVRVVNRETHEVVSQIPAEYLLRLAEDLKPQPADSTPGRD